MVYSLISQVNGWISTLINEKRDAGFSSPYHAHANFGSFIYLFVFLHNTDD